MFLAKYRRKNIFFKAVKSFLVFIFKLCAVTTPCYECGWKSAAWPVGWTR